MVVDSARRHATLESEAAPTERVVVDPARVRQFGDAMGTHFRLVTDAAHADAFVISTTAQYETCAVTAVEDGMEFEEVISGAPVPAHVLVISPSRFFESPPDDVIGPRRKLLAMACNSTPTDLAVIRHFLRVIERTDPAEQDACAERFFETIEQAEYLEVVHMGTRSALRFDHLRDDYVWNQQAGSVDWGEQQIVPSGEISVLPIEIRSFDSALCLALNGELTLNGHPILHSGTPSHLRTDQARLHQELLAMRDHPIVATVEGGRISALRATGPGCAPAVEALEAMFHVDSRYRIVWEIGHAVNTSLDLLPGNHAMNEVYGGDRGCLHWGLGLTPYTQYHLDIISPGTRVLTDRGIPVLG